jgi:hypothetical protein
LRCSFVTGDSSSFSCARNVRNCVTMSSGVGLTVGCGVSAVGAVGGLELTRFRGHLKIRESHDARKP